MKKGAFFFKNDFTFTRILNRQINYSYFMQSTFGASKIENTSLENSTFHYEDLRGSTFKNVSFKNSNLSGSDLSCIAMKQVSFESDNPLNSKAETKNMTNLLETSWGCSGTSNFRIFNHNELEKLCQLPEESTFTYKIWLNQDQEEGLKTSNRSIICTQWNIDNPFIN